MKKGYEEDIRMLQGYIKRLQEIKEALYTVEELALDVERGVCEIDGRLPRREELSGVRDAVQRARAEHALDLLEESFSLIDEILGAPDDELTGEPVGTPMDPVARGAKSGELQLDDFLRNYRPGSKNKAS